MRAIDADALKERFVKKQAYFTEAIIDKIETAPSIEIIRCRECKYWNRNHNYCEGIGNWFGELNSWSENGFCYKGERSE